MRNLAWTDLKGDIREEGQSQIKRLIPTNMESKDTKRGDLKRTGGREPTIRLSAGGKTLETGESGTGGDGILRPALSLLHDFHSA